MAAAFAFIDFRTWLVLTVNGLAMGGMIFLMASGMTLTFGLMSVLNMAHGAFISLGAFAGGTVLAFWLNDLTDHPSLLMNLVVIVPALLFAALVTVGGSIILMQLIKIIWDPNEILMARPEAISGAVHVAESIPLINRYVNLENTLNLKLMVFILLMCVIGGMGTLYGAIVRVTLFTLAQNYLQDLLK
jgi:branched-chain amino acid transport system permease protein